MDFSLFSCFDNSFSTHSNRFYLFLLLFGLFHMDFTGAMDSFDSVGDLEKTTYKVMDGFPCVRLLSLSGEIGCSNPGGRKVVSPIVTFKNVENLSQPHAVLLPLNEMQQFFSRISSNPNFRKGIGGVLIEAGDEFHNKLEGFSPDEKFPQAEFAPYSNKKYDWNLFGSGILLNFYNFPVFLLSEIGTAALKERIGG